MEKHFGEIIEKVIRRNGYNISEVAKLMDVNRRSIYNWFAQPKLKAETIFKIGCVLRHDFSKEFPELFSSEEFERAFEEKKQHAATSTVEHEKVNFWKDKYIQLLEEYNEILATGSANFSRERTYAL